VKYRFHLSVVPSDWRHNNRTVACSVASCRCSRSADRISGLR
jgi:hypothetical protein